MITSSRCDQGSVIPLGFLLVVGISVVGLGVLFSTVVPVVNENAEIESHKSLETDVLELVESQSQVMSSGVSIQSVVGTSVSYVMAPQVSDQQSIAVNGDYKSSVSGLNTSDISVESSSITVEREYAYVESSRVFRVDNGVGVSDADGSMIALSDQRMISGTQITLIDVGDTDSVTGSPPMVVNMDRQDVVTKRVKNASGERVVVEFESQITGVVWKQLLSEELVSNGGYIQSISSSESGSTYRIRVELVPGEYTVSVYDVGVSVR